MMAGQLSVLMRALEAEMKLFHLAMGAIRNSLMTEINMVIIVICSDKIVACSDLGGTFLILLQLQGP